MYQDSYEAQAQAFNFLLLLEPGKHVLTFTNYCTAVNFATIFSNDCKHHSVLLKY